jgi:hypothetical protein
VTLAPLIAAGLAYDVPMCRLAFIAAILVAHPARARADVANSGSIDVEVGGTIEVDVGYARGLRCDDVSIVRADLVTRNDHNYFVVTGLKVGSTHCRVGTSASTPPWFLFEIRVASAKAR